MEINTPRGTRDFFGEEMSLRRRIKDTIRRNYIKFGFEELDTPAFENFEIFTVKGGAGEAIRDEIYYFKDKSDRELGLRFDFTVPLARFVSGNKTLARPFKRFQIGKVWRYDRPAKGRYREFEQADADIIGVKEEIADAECLALISSCLKDLGIKDGIIKINSRKIVEGIVLEAGIAKKDIMEAFRSIDKLEKIGEKGVKKELTGKKLEAEGINKILELLKIKGNNKEILKKLEKLIENETGKEGIKEINKILELLENFKIKTKIQLDLSLVRGLEYYTGLVIECASEKNKDVGSFCGGGRYDKLISLYCGGKIEGVGFSFGIDRIVDILNKERNNQRNGIYICTIGNVLNNAIEISQKIRNSGIKTDINQLNRNIGNQLKYADNKNFQFVIILGERELKENELTIKNLGTGKEERIKISDVEKWLKVGG